MYLPTKIYIDLEDPPGVPIEMLSVMSDRARGAGRRHKCHIHKTTKRRFLQFHIFVASVAGVSHVSQDCHRDVARLSRSVTRCRRCVTRCHRNVTAKSHICHTLSQAVATTVTLVTPCHRVSIHLSTCRQVDIYPLPRCAGWGVALFLGHGRCESVHA